MANDQIQPVRQGGSEVRIGPITIFAFVVILCMAVLAVLSFTTGHASLTMSQRQATSMNELYLDETAAQSFLADLDDQLVSVKSAAGTFTAVPKTNSATGATSSSANSSSSAATSGASGASGVSASKSSASASGEDLPSATVLWVIQNSLDSMCRRASDAANGQVQVSATMEDAQIDAEFTCENGRVLYVTLTIRSDATYRIDKWKMTAVKNEAEPAGNLWTGM